MEILMLLLPMFIENILPMILNKPKDQQRKAFLRKMARYEMIANSDTADAEIRFACGELADMCGCLAQAENDDEIQAITGAAMGFSTGLQRSMGA